MKLCNFLHSTLANHITAKRREFHGYLLLGHGVETFRFSGGRV